MVAPALTYGALALMGINQLSSNANQAKNDAATRRAQADLLKRMEQAGVFYEQYRPQMAAARANAFNSQLSAYQGANNALTTMYGAENAPAAQMPGMMMLPPHEGDPHWQQQQADAAASAGRAASDAGNAAAADRARQLAEYERGQSMAGASAGAAASAAGSAAAEDRARQMRAGAIRGAAPMTQTPLMFSRKGGDVMGAPGGRRLPEFY